MGLWENFCDWVQSWNRDATKATAVPNAQKGLNVIENAKRELQQFESQIIDLVTATKLMIDDQRVAEENFVKYDAAAKKFAAQVKSGNQDARRSLDACARKVQHFRITKDALAKQIDSNNDLIEKLEQQKDAITAQVEQAETTHVSLEAREMGAKMRQNLSGGFNGKGVAALKDYERQVRESEARAAATEEVHISDDDLLEDVEKNNLADEYLAAV